MSSVWWSFVLVKESATYLVYIPSTKNVLTTGWCDHSLVPRVLKLLTQLSFLLSSPLNNDLLRQNRFDLMEILSLTIKECITTGWCDFSLAHHVHCSSYIYLFSSEWWIINLTRKFVFDGLLKHIQLCACSTCWLLYHIFSTLFTLS